MRGAMILADGFETAEALATADVLRRAGIKLDLVGINTTMPESDQGIRVQADRRFSPGLWKEYDFLVIPGGSAWKKLSVTESVLQEIREFHKSGKLVAAICGGPVVLAKAGILEDREAVCYPGLERELPHPRDKRVLDDRNIITSQGPGTAMEFGLRIVEKLLGPQKANALKEKLLVR